MASASRFSLYFRKQQRNVSNILIVSTSASANSHLNKSYLCLKGEHSRRNIQHFYAQRKSTEFARNLSLHSAKRRHGQAKRFHTLCFKFEFPVLYFKLSAYSLMESEFVFNYVRSFTSVLNFCCSACKLMLSGKNTTDLKNMFNSR